MCTMTLIQSMDHLRIAFNRDEERTRPPALPPETRMLGGIRAIMPIDPASGGTWIAACDTGLVLALLNVNPPQHIRKPSTISRGTIIPTLVPSVTWQSALKHALKLDPSQFAPFRLVLASRDVMAEVRSDGEQLVVMRNDRITTPLMCTSSGLGDHLVEAPRRTLFDELFATDGDEERQQNRFHCHQWPEHRHLSVNMSRDDACTVSHTIVSIGETKISMCYHAGRPDEPANNYPARLTLRGASIPSHRR